MLTKTLLLMLLLTSSCLAGTVEYDGEQVEYDDELSFKNFTNWEFISRSEYDFTGKTIYQTVFTQEKPDSVIFPEGTKNVTFVNCHLQNVILPEGSIVIAPDCDGKPCWTESFKVQNDLRDWVIDDQKRPVKVMNEEYWVEKGISVDPRNIPEEKIVKGDKTLEDKLKELDDARSEVDVEVIP